MKIIASCSFGLKKYLEAANAVAVQRVASECDCEECVALRNEANPDYKILADVFAKFEAVGRLEGLSIVIDKPGIYKFANLVKKTDGKFSSVFFEKPGRYGLVKIYKHAKYMVEKNAFSSLLTKATKESFGEKKAKSFNSLFCKILPYGFKNVEELEASELWKTNVLNKLLDDKNGVKKDAAPVVAVAEVIEEVKLYQNIGMIDDRYIPFITCGTVLNHFDKTNKIIKNNFEIPDQVPKNKAGASNYFKLKTSEILQKASPFGNYYYDTNMHVFAYDIESDKLVISDELTATIITWVKDSNKKLFDNKFNGLPDQQHLLYFLTKTIHVDTTLIVQVRILTGLHLQLQQPNLHALRLYQYTVFRLKRCLRNNLEYFCESAHLYSS